MKKTGVFFIYLFFLSCMGQLVSDVYLPALPMLRHVFHTTTRTVQFSLAIFMFGFAVSHLIYGPISDSAGRKKPLLIGTLICVIGTLFCLFSTNINWFLLGRFLQGAGAGASATLFRSILRDLYSGNRLAKIGSVLVISRVILLANAPLIGGYLLHYFGWRSCFTFLLIYTTCCLAGSYYILEETNSYQQQHVLHWRDILKNHLMLITHPTFMSYAFCVMLAFAGILAWLTDLPFLLQDVVGLTPLQFGWVSAIAGLFFILGGFMNALVVERFGLHAMTVVGISIMLLGSALMLLFGLKSEINTIVIMFPVVIYIIGSSFVFANSFAGAMHPFEKIAGTASAVFGFLQILGGAISSTLMSIIQTYNQIPLALTLLGSAMIALMIMFPRSRHSA